MACVTAHLVNRAGLSSRKTNVRAFVGRDFDMNRSTSLPAPGLVVLFFDLIAAERAERAERAAT